MISWLNWILVIKIYIKMNSKYLISFGESSTRMFFPFSLIQRSCCYSNESSNFPLWANFSYVYQCSFLWVNNIPSIFLEFSYTNCIILDFIESDVGSLILLFDMSAYTILKFEMSIVIVILVSVLSWYMLNYPIHRYHILYLFCIR